MKKLTVFAVVVLGLAVVGFVGPASATPMTITDTTLFDAAGTTPAEDYDSHLYGSVNKLDGILDYVTWTHHFPDPPNPEIDHAISGTITVYLSDDEGDVWWNPLTWEYGGGYGEDATWAFGEVDTGEYTYGVTASYLDDGEFQVTVGSVWGDFYIDQSDLEVTYEPAAAPPVPEASTLMLFGSGLSGLLFYARKKRLIKF